MIEKQTNVVEFLSDQELMNVGVQTSNSKGPSCSTDHRTAASSSTMVHREPGCLPDPFKVSRDPSCSSDRTTPMTIAIGSPEGCEQETVCGQKPEGCE